MKNEKTEDWIHDDTQSDRRRQKGADMRRLLLTNDDGILSDGLIRLAEAALSFGEVWVVAPERQRSAASHSITLHETIDVFPHAFPVPGIRAFACGGTPADCVRLGCLNLLPEKPELVLSGINCGYNAGTDLQYSATVGAALEGAFQLCHAVALSEGEQGVHEVTDACLHDILAELIDTPLGWGQIHNVNFPGCALSDCRGVLRDRTVSRGTFYHDRYQVRAELPEGGKRFMVDGQYNEEAEPGTDKRAILENWVSVGIVNNLC